MKDKSELKKGIFWSIICFIYCIIAYLFGAWAGEKCAKHFGNYYLSDE